MQQQQQQQLYPLAYPQSHMLAPLQTVSMPLGAPGSLLDSSSGSSNSSSSNSVSTSSSVPSMGSSTLSVPSVTAAHAPAADVLYCQASTAAAAATVTQPGVAMISPAAGYGNMMLYAPAAGPFQVTMQQQQQLPAQVHYEPVQQVNAWKGMCWFTASRNAQCVMHCVVMRGAPSLSTCAMHPHPHVSETLQAVSMHALLD